MAKNETRRLRPKVKQRDVDAFAALKGLSNYNPSKPECKIDSIQPIADAMKAAQEEEVKAYGIADERRDDATAKEWEFHNIILAVIDQVIAQYGDNSDELQKLGLKKKSEYKAPTRRPRTT